MDELTQDEKVETLARLAVSMHLEAWKKVGNASMYVIILAVLAAIYGSSFWPLVIAAGLCVAITFYVIHSCRRYVERQTGMPRAIQDFYYRRYKTDVQFAKEVDQLHERASDLARRL